MKSALLYQNEKSGILPIVQQWHFSEIHQRALSQVLERRMRVIHYRWILCQKRNMRHYCHLSLSFTNRRNWRKKRNPRRYLRIQEIHPYHASDVKGIKERSRKISWHCSRIISYYPTNLGINLHKLINLSVPPTSLRSQIATLPRGFLSDQEIAQR